MTERRSEAASSVARAFPLRDRKAERSEVSRVRRDRERGSRHVRGNSDFGAVDSANGRADAWGTAPADRRQPCVCSRLHRFPGIPPFPPDDCTALGPCLSPVRNRHDLPAVGPLGERTLRSALRWFTSAPIRAFKEWTEHAGERERAVPELDLGDAFRASLPRLGVVGPARAAVLRHARRTHAPGGSPRDCVDADEQRHRHGRARRPQPVL